MEVGEEIGNRIGVLVWLHLGLSLLSSLKKN